MGTSAPTDQLGRQSPALASSIEPDAWLAPLPQTGLPILAVSTRHFVFQQLYLTRENIGSPGFHPTTLYYAFDATVQHVTLINNE